MLTGFLYILEIEVTKEFACARDTCCWTKLNIPLIPRPRLFVCLLWQCVSDPDTCGKTSVLFEIIFKDMASNTKQTVLLLVWWVEPRRNRLLRHTCRYNKVRELIAVKVLHTSFLNTTVVAFKVLPLGTYVPMPAPSPPFKTILEMVLWNGLQICRYITPGVTNVIKMPSFQYFLYLREQKKVTGG